jgi:hypothetical protein
MIGCPNPLAAATPPQEQLRRFETIIRCDPDLMRLLASIRGVPLPQWRLVAGCLYQTVWNVLTGRDRGTGIKDYNLIYFDDGDFSWAAEDRVIRRIGVATRDCVGPVEVRNQARVHLWFETRFGAAYSRLYSADEAIQRYASMVHAIGVRLETMVDSMWWRRLASMIFFPWWFDQITRLKMQSGICAKRDERRRFGLR